MMSTTISFAEGYLRTLELYNVGLTFGISYLYCYKDVVSDCMLWNGGSEKPASKHQTMIQ